MRRTATVAAGTAIAIAVFGGGLAMAFDGGGSSAAGPASVTLTAAPSGRPEDGAAAPRPDSSGTSAPRPDSNGAGPSVPSGTARATEISRSEAERAALRAVPGGRIDSVELEREHGRPVWKVDVLSGGVEHRIQVDARTGAVAREKSKDGGEGGRGRDDARATDDHGRHDR